MNAGEIISSVIGAIAVGLLTFIARAIKNIGGDFRRFMQEHMWLLATTLWTRDKVVRIMTELNLPMDQPPPNDLPKEKGK